MAKGFLKLNYSAREGKLQVSTYWRCVWGVRTICWNWLVGSARSQWHASVLPTCELFLVKQTRPWQDHQFGDKQPSQFRRNDAFNLLTDRPVLTNRKHLAMVIKITATTPTAKK